MSKPSSGSFFAARARVCVAGAAGVVGMGLLAATVGLAAASCGGSSAAAAPDAPTTDGGAADHTAPDTGVTPVPSCASPRSACASGCVDLASDPKNCGMCSMVCPGAGVCSASKCVATMPTGFAARKVWLGDTDRGGAASSTAWMAYGRNIDGIVSVGGTPNGECKPVSGAAPSVATDGTDGIDNSWGKSIVPLLQTFAPTPSPSVNTTIEAGARTPMVDLGGQKGDIASFAMGLVTAESTIAPQWNGLDSRPIASSSTTGGKASTIFASAKITGGVVTSGDATVPYVLSFALGGSSLDLPIHVPRVTMTIAKDGKTASQGTISGVIGTEELVAAFARVAGSISTSLCSGSTIDTINAQLRSASDILSDGTQDPNADCDGISIGIGFEAAAVAVGPVAAPVSPAKDPCAP